MLPAVDDDDNDALFTTHTCRYTIGRKKRNMTPRFVSAPIESPLTAGCKLLANAG